jgi:hypothetical protein
MRYTRSAILAAVTLLVAGVAAAQTPPPPTTPDKQLYVAGKFALEITSPSTAQVWVQSVEGGHAVSDVVLEKVGTDQIQRKHLAGVKYTPITIRSRDPELLRPFVAALDQPGLTFDGRILSVNFNESAVSELSFSRGVVTQIVLSAFDGASKDPGKVEITISPEETRTTPVRDGKFSGLAGKTSEKLAPLGIQLSMAGLDAALSHVTRVETITMMHTGMGAGVGEYARALPGKWESGNIVLNVPVAYAKDLYEWQKEVQLGRADAVQKTLDLHLLAGGKEMLVLHANGVALVSLRGDEIVPANASEHVVKAELSVKGYQVSSAGTALR